MHCDQAQTEIIAYLKGELGEGKKERLEEHLARCPNCRHELEGARRLLAWTDAASEEAVAKSVEKIMDTAISDCASDIHIESQRDNTLLVRVRIDGVLHEVARIDASMRNGIIARLKMMGEMDVSQTSLPQDGRIPWTFEGRNFDVRINITPFVYGEGIVMRILDQSDVMLGLDQLTFFEDHLKAVREMIHRPTGLVFVSGPTGSGKTTTLYSMLKELTSPAVKVMTIEDPVEYVLPGVEHAQVVKKIGFTFPVALRTFMRRDPDVIMVGDIKDYETMAIAIEAAITGHMVLSSLHTNDAAEVIQRLRDIGIEDFLIAATLAGTVNQRLARKVCPSCKTRLTPESQDSAMAALGITKDDLATHEVYTGAGCEACRNTGYRGRVALYEVLTIDRDLSAMIGEHATTSEIIEAAKPKGFMTMAEDGKRKILAGMTTPGEALRVLSQPVV